MRPLLFFKLILLILFLLNCCVVNAYMRRVKYGVINIFNYLIMKTKIWIDTYEYIFSLTKMHAFKIKKIHIFRFKCLRI